MNHNDKKLDRPIFICGCHRTGTTLLQRSLSLHPNIDILPETKILAWQWTPWNKISKRLSEKTLSEISRLMPLINRAWGSEENRTRLERLRQSQPHSQWRTAGDAMEHLLKVCAGLNGEERVGEKSPLHIYHVASLLRHFPNAKILITRRDLRAAFYSQLSRQRKGLSYRKLRTSNFVIAWLSAMKLADKYLEEFGSERIKFVDFRSLVCDSESTFREIAQFLDIPFRSELLSTDFSNSSFGDQQGGLDPKTADRWRTGLPANIRKHLENIAGEHLVRYGFMNQSEATRFQISDQPKRLAANAASAIAQKTPESFCFFAKDSRFRKYAYRTPVWDPAKELSPKVIVLGNQKSGTTAIATLLSVHSGLTKTIDIPRKWRKSGYALARGQLTLTGFVSLHPTLFETELVKIPALTFVGEQVASHFQNSKIVFVLRDPRANIRSLLNRRKIRGDLDQAPANKKWLMKFSKKPFLDESIWGDGEQGFIEILANRWNAAVNAFHSLGKRAHPVKYEDFESDKVFAVKALASELGHSGNNDISQIVDVQFQPPGKRTRSWKEFFGEKNLATINRICAPNMQSLGYSIEED